ncbi:unnamed protein product [Cylindrotheca closterium]|uniref:DUF6824 domain-containing protein n=1 Tax=Cylindrotheca closterium TaxID=2856 RepID=A0AAD2CDA1_9STRA|nr:unnamed protein product [Cylindrotheca closterium]
MALLRRHHLKSSKKLTKNGSSFALATKANKVSTTSVAIPVPTRRVSDPDIDTRHQHHHQPRDLASSEDASIASSSYSDEVSCQPVINQLRSSQDDGAPVMGLNSSTPKSVSIVPESVSESKDSTLKTQPNGGNAQLSFQDMFQKWHSNRIVKRRLPSVQAFPKLSPFEGFHESNTAQGYTFGPYFDRWYVKQQKRSAAMPSPSSRKRPSPINYPSNSGDNAVASPNPPAPKKQKSQSEASSIQQQRNLNSLHKWNAVNALYRSEIVELPVSFVPGPYTVIMGRRLKAPGCVHLRYVTDQYAKEYKQSDAMAKSRIVTLILKIIYEKAPIGAFVRCKARRYYEVEDLIAREKIVSELIAGGLQI